MAGPAGTQAVDRAAAVLTAVLGATDPVTFADLVARTGLPKSTVSRLTTSLERNGLLQRTAAGAWQPGTAITDYALSVRPEDDLLRIAQPFLDALGSMTGETVNLAVPLAGEVRPVAHGPLRLKEAAKLGFAKAFGPGDGAGMAKGHREIALLRNLVDQVMGGS